jgi:serine phosphatase RsbU (regulator of sigma subunit)
MHYVSIEELLGLSEAEALRRHFDSFNYRSYRYFALSAAAILFGASLYFLVISETLRLLLPVANLAVIRLLFVLFERPAGARHFRAVLPLYVLAQLIVLACLDPGLEYGPRLAGFVGAFVLVAFRFTLAEHATLYLLSWAGTFVRHWSSLVDSEIGSRFSVGSVIAQTIVSIVCLYFAVSATQQEKLRFRRAFQIETSKSRERRRMREELDSARQIQLSMLPRSDPKLAGLDIASISLPANEVGGDYYEYFERSATEVAIVVGDVAGHGVASGLTLSGIRSCLHLLHEDRPPPVEILNRLDRMLQRTTTQRNFVTLLYALFDCSARLLTVGNAGHPPPLLYRASSGELREITHGAPPLGTRLAATYEQRIEPLAAGDVLALYSDGLFELQNADGELYGLDRLLARFRAAANKPAREIRESILSDLWNFKGDNEQIDDVTLVVVRVR